MCSCLGTACYYEMNRRTGVSGEQLLAPSAAAVYVWPALMDACRWSRDHRHTTCMAAHARDLFWKTWGRISPLVWCQGPRPGEAAKGCRLRQSRAEQEVNPYPAPTSTPTNRPLPRDSVCLALSSTIPSFPPSPPVPPVVLQNATKSATSLKSPQQAKFAGAHSISEGVRKLMYTCASECLSSHMFRTRSALPASPRLPSSKSNTDWPDRIGLVSSFIRGITFPAIFPSTHHRPLHLWYCLQIGVTLKLDDSPHRLSQRGMTSVSRHAC